LTAKALTTFITLLSADGVPQGRYQNGPLGTIELEGESFAHLQFLYEGTLRDRLGDNLQAEMVLANNPLAMEMVQAAVRGQWLVRFATCAMHPETMAVGRVLSREVWTVTGPSYDPSQITVELASALDAIGATAPSISLTSAMVGALPVSGRIQNL
jgi:hypothetical protein